MTELKRREKKMQEKRQNTDWRGFIKNVVSWQNISFTKREGMISRYPETERINKILSPLQMQEIREKLLEYGFDYDFEKGFFSNFQKLFTTVPFSSVIDYGLNENCDYADACFGSKNVYLSNTIIGGENVLYSMSTKPEVTNILNSLAVWHNCENVFFSSGIIQSFNIFYSKNIYNSNNCWFSSNLIGCSECIKCDGLENQSYCIENKQYSKEEYKKEKLKYLQQKENFLNWYTQIVSEGISHNCEDVTGKYIINMNVKNGNNIFFTGGEQDENMYDCFIAGSGVCNDFYGVLNAGTGNQNLYNSLHIGFSSNIYYSFDLQHCSFCIGCIGLRNRSFCILNKQYSKEEWYEMADKIFAQMEEEGKLGDFFPGWLNPFYFNDTAAYLMDDGFSKEEVEKEGYMRRDENIKVDIPEGMEIVKTDELDNYQGYDKNGEWKIDPEILKKVIKDKNGNYYRIVKMEYDFLVKHGLPLPEIHWLDRIKEGLKSQ